MASARPATALRSSSSPSAPSAITSAMEAIIVCRSGNVPDSRADRALCAADSQRPNTASMQASTATRSACSAGCSSPAARPSRIAAASPGRPNIHVRLAARTVAHRWLSARPFALISRKSASARSPRPSRTVFIACIAAASATPDSAAAVAKRSARSRSNSVIANRAASTNSAGSGGRSDSSVSNALRTVACISRSASFARRRASRPRILDRYISPAVARRSSPNSGCANRAESAPAIRSMVTRCICSATSTSRGRAKSHSTSTPSGSHCDKMSRTSTSSGVNPPSSRPTMSPRFCDTATPSSHIHTPATCRIRPAATWSFSS